MGEPSSNRRPTPVAVALLPAPVSVRAPASAPALALAHSMDLASIDCTQLLQLFLEHAPGAIAMFDREMRYILASRRWLSDYQLTEPLAGRSHYQVFPEIPPRWREAHRRALEGETLGCEEEPFERADGQSLWLRWEIRPWRTDDGRIGGILIFSEDITARKRAEAERARLATEIAGRSARIAEDRWFRELLEAAPDAMVIIDTSGKIVLANSQAERLFGYARAELLERPIEVLVDEQARAGHAERRERYFGDPRVRPMAGGHPLAARRKDGSVFPAEISLSPLRTERGLWVSSAIRDVSERQRTEEALARLAAVVETAGDAIISADLSGAISSWNPAAERLFGYRAVEAIGQDLRMLWPSGRGDKERRILDRVERGEQVAPYETERRRKDGSLVEVWLSTSVLRDRHGSIIGTARIVRDLTERKTLERRLEREARTDLLTGAATRRAFRELAQREWLRTLRHGGDLSIVALDLDHFKDVNDRFGHAAGDRLLQLFVRECARVLREEDLLARIGGDEFACLLPQTDANTATAIARRLQAAIARVQLPIDAAAPIGITASIGVASLRDDDIGIDGLIDRADRAAYDAKRAGRNAVHVAPTLE